MARDTATADTPTTDSAEEQWEDIKVGLGEEWDLEHEGTITGVFQGMETLDVEDRQNGGMRETNAYRIETEEGTKGPNRFIWGSYNLDLAMKEIQVGDTVRVSFVGRNTFTGDKGPQTVKTYRVQRRAN